MPKRLFGGRRVLSGQMNLRVIVPECRMRSRCENLPDKFDRVRLSTGLMRDQIHEMKSIGVARLLVQCPSISSFGLLQPAGLMQR